SEFWEEVVEKDYEIISIAANPEKYICTDKNDIKNFIDKTGMSLYEIHSVQRLTDSEIFTISDKVKYSYFNLNINETVTKTYTIEKIYFIEKGRIALYVGEGLNLGITNIKKAKTPIFTTED